MEDFGTGEKKLGIYLAGLVVCVLLTLLSFWTVMASEMNRGQMIAVIYASAIVQFLVQVICFLRLNIQTEQARTNVMALLFTVVILAAIVIGSLWIMWNLNYNMGM